MRWYLWVVVLFLGGNELWASDLWIVGETYVARYHQGQLVSFPIEEPGNSAFDPKVCRLWVDDGISHELLQWDEKGRTVLAPQTAVLSDFSEHHFYTRKDAKTLERRDGSGQVTAESASSWVSFSQQMMVAGFQAWSINDDFKGQRTWLSHIDEKGIESQVNPISVGRVIWPNHRLLRDPQSDNFWLGYSGGAEGLMDTPFIEHRDAQGKIIEEYRWKQRGRFHDFCLDGRDSVLVSRDVPSSSGFTIPLFSYLEKLVPTQKSQTIYSAEQDDIVDALLCFSDKVILAQHSVHGSVGSWLTEWDRRPGTFARELVRLPAPAYRVYRCE